MRGTLRLIVVFALGLALLAGGIGEVATSFTDSEASLANSLQAWTSTLWLQTTLADFEAGIVPGQADTRSSPGDVGLARANRIFAFQGGSASLWAYGVPGNSWASMAGPPAPNTVGTGGALAYDGAQYIYALRGGGNRNFWRYDTTTDTWLARPNTSANVGAGGALAYGNSGFVYAFHGNGTTTFRRYRIANNIWQNRTATSVAVGAGGALAYDGSGFIYAFHGNGTTTFRRYRTANNTWQNRTAAPAAVGAGGALASDGSRYIYAFTGNTTTAFWRYDTTSNSWAAMTSAPATVGAGGALAYDGSGYIYAFSGNGSNAFLRYDVLNNAWTVMAVAPGGVGNGGALAFVGSSTYATSAAIASQVRDTGTVGAGWDGLFWDETLPLNTDITFEVRASDTLFAAGDVTPTWVSVGGTSPVTSGLPSGRYMQWQATLTTSDIMVTPLLNEVRAYYY